MNGPVEIQGFRFGPFRLDLSSYQLWRGDEHLAITPKSFDTLAVLIKHRDRVLPKEELMNAVWPDAFVSEDNLTQAISVLRRTLGDDPNQPTFIATAARHGYRFIGTVHEIPAAPAETIAAVAAPHAPASRDSSSNLPQRAVRATRSSGRRWVLVTAAFGLAVVSTVIVRNIAVARAVPAAPPLRFVQDAPPGTMIASGGVLSLDGRYVLFTARDERTAHSHLWVRALNAAEPRMLADTEDARRPFWSPDAKAVAFFVNGKLKKVSLDGGPAQTIAQVGTSAESGSWGTGGTILFATGRSSLNQVSAQGGTPVSVTVLDPSAREISHRRPQFLPDGHHFLFFVESVNPEHAGTYLGSFDSPAKTRLLDVVADYAPPHYLLYVRDHVLVAQNFEIVAARVSGPPATVAANVLPPDISNGAMISASADGLLTFSVSKAVERLDWFSRSGQLLATVDAPVALRNPVFLLNQRRFLAASNIDTEHKGIWMFDVDRATLTRVANDGMRPFASPDGTQIAFGSDRKAGVADIYVRSLDGRDGDEQLLLATNENKFLCDWSADGRYLLYGSRPSRTNSDLWLLPLMGPDTKPRAFLQTPANEICGQISPDGRWIAYASDETGVWEVYVQSFPASGNKQSVSVGGGMEPHWRTDGRELFYIAADRNVTAVAVTPGPTLGIGTRTTLFRAPIASFDPYVNRYTVATDGQRFLINSTEEPKRNRELVTIIINWMTLL